MSKVLFDQAFFEKLEKMNLYFKNNADNLYSGGRRSKAHGSTVEFSDFREYSFGDDYRRIDWNAYARFEKFFIKLFLDEKQLHTRVIIDMSKSMSFGNPSKGDLAKQLAAALSYMSIRALDRSSIIAFADDVDYIARAIEGLSAFYRAMEYFEALEFKGESLLYENIKKIEKISRGDGVFIIISDLLTESDYKAMIDYLLYLNQQVLLIHILSQEDIEPAFEGKVRLIDSEKKENVDLDISPRIMDVYRETVKAYNEDIGRFCQSRGVQLIQVISHEDFETVLMDKGYRAGIIN